MSYAVVGGYKLRVNRPIRGKKKLSKTDMIASMFSSRPFDDLSPKQIASELELNIQLVTTIVNRLKDEGLVERVGWGKYKLKIDQAIDDSYIIEINRELREMSLMILGGNTELDVTEQKENPYLELISIYRSIKIHGGKVLAINLLRLCSKKSLSHDNMNMLIKNMEEVVE